jgi:CheY-like chemotaxis protein
MSTRRVLIVDDEDDIREVAQTSLDLIGGWEVLTARSGDQAVGIAARERPDAILLDVMMPGVDGPQTLGRLRADPLTSAIPVIFITAKVQAADRLRLAELGAQGVIAKPFDPVTLPGEIADALGWS